MIYLEEQKYSSISEAVSNMTNVIEVPWSYNNQCTGLEVILLPLYPTLITYFCIGAMIISV